MLPSMSGTHHCTLHIYFSYTYDWDALEFYAFSSIPAVFSCWQTPYKCLLSLSPWFGIRMVQGFFECLGLVFDGLGVLGYHDNSSWINQKVWIFFLNFFLSCLLLNFVCIFIIKSMKFFITCIIFGLSVVLEVTLISSSIHSSKMFSSTLLLFVLFSLWVKTFWPLLYHPTPQNSLDLL